MGDEEYGSEDSKEIRFNGETPESYPPQTPEPVEEPKSNISPDDSDERVDKTVNQPDLADIKINAEKVVVEGGMEGLENEPPKPPAGGSGSGSGSGSGGGAEGGSSSIGSGFQGPLAVDSVGDYLDDKTDWAAIDAASRQKAKIAFDAMEKARDEEEDAADAKKEAGKKERERKKAKQAQRWLDRAEEGEDVPKAFADLPRHFDGNFISDDGRLPGEERPGLADPEEGKKGEEGNARIPDDVGLGAKKQSFVPNTGPGTPEHVASQRHVDMTDFGVQGPSHYQLNGQNESAVQEAIDLSSDAIKTVTAAVVDTLTDLATVLNQHHDAIQTLRDIVASSGEEDVR